MNRSAGNRSVKTFDECDEMNRNAIVAWAGYDGINPFAKEVHSAALGMHR